MNYLRTPNALLFGYFNYEELDITHVTLNHFELFKMDQNGS